MKYFILFLAAVHGLIHLMGFVNGFGLMKLQGFSGQTIFPLSKTGLQITSAAWAATALLFFVSIAIFFLHKTWAPLALLAIVLSQVLIVLYWPDAKWGTVANVILAIVTLISFASQRFSKKVNDDVQALFSNQVSKKEMVTEEMLAGLPQPVQTWLKHSGIVGKEKIYSVRLKQRGWMRNKPEQKEWNKAIAEQYFTVDEPAFIWQVKMNMMLLMPVSGCDRFVNGRGSMQIKLWSLFNAVNSSGPKIDEGALQRYLAEICWMPSAALSPYIKWNATNDSSALATLSYNGVSGEVVFHFTGDGDIRSCTAARYKGGGPDDKKEVWQVVTKKIDVRNGIRIPVQSEATWRLKEGDFTWYKIDITNIEYNEPRLFSETEFR